jgi:hypothetical protein
VKSKKAPNAKRAGTHRGNISEGRARLGRPFGAAHRVHASRGVSRYESRVLTVSRGGERPHGSRRARVRRDSRGEPPA